MSEKAPVAGKSTTKLWRPGTDSGIMVPEEATLWPNIDFVTARDETSLSEPQREMKDLLDRFRKEGYPVYHDTNSPDTTIVVLGLHEALHRSFDWEHVSMEDVANLIKMHDEDMFYKAWNGGLEVRVAKLGWKGTCFATDENRPARIDINDGPICIMTFLLTDSTTIPELERAIELEEVKRELLSKRNLFKAAKMDIKIIDDKLHICLQGNDPELIREATHENLERFLMLACCCNARVFDMLKLTLRTLGVL